MKKITLKWDITYPLTTKVDIKKITILQKVTNHFHLEKEIHSTQLSLAELQHQIISISNLVLKTDIMYGPDHNLQVNCKLLVLHVLALNVENNLIYLVLELPKE